MKYFRSNRRHFKRKKYILCVLKCVCACSVASVLSDSTTLWTVAHQAPVSMGFSRQEYCSGLPDPPPGDLRTQGSNLGLLHCRQILYGWVFGEAHVLKYTRRKRRMVIRTYAGNSPHKGKNRRKHTSIYFRKTRLVWDALIQTGY